MECPSEWSKDLIEVSESRIEEVSYIYRLNKSRFAVFHVKMI